MRLKHWLWLSLGCVAIGATLLVTRSRSTPRAAEEPTTSQPAPTSRPAVVLFRKPLTNGNELVVIEEPLIPIATARNIVSEEFIKGQLGEPADRAIGMVSVHAEIRMPSGPPLRVWSWNRIMADVSDYDQFRIFDLIVVPDRLIFLCTDTNRFLWLVEANLGGRWRMTAPPRWGQLGAFVPIKPGQLVTKLSYDEKTQRIGLDITDTLSSSGVTCRRHTTYEQQGDEWVFHLLSADNEEGGVRVTSPYGD